MNAFPIPDFASFQSMPSQMPSGIDFMKQFWQNAAAAQAATTPPTSGSANVGGASPAFMQAMSQYLMPTMDIDELDKRMSDMRTVLQFMELNTNMLRQSLSALEVQRNTLATLKGLAQGITQPTAQAASQAHAEADATPATAWFSVWQDMVQNGMQQVTQTAQTNQEIVSEAMKTAATAAKPAAARKKAPAKKAAK